MKNITNGDDKLEKTPVKKLIWQLGLPMVVSMVLQAVYNVVDTIFVINSSAATQGNAALTAAFPIQILIIAIGVGTGVGLNALLSRKLGEKDEETAAKVAGNGIFLAIVIYAVFLLFGLFLAKPYMRLLTNDETVSQMGAEYLYICCTLSFGAIGFTVYERFLQATGKTTQTMIAQLSGAAANVLLDYVFVIVLNGGVAGAAYATIIGQILSLAIAMVFHYATNKAIKPDLKYVKPDRKIIASVYKIGIPAAIMQSLLAVMMFAVLQVFRIIENKTTYALMVNAYGIYYKIMQTALFASFGLSNALITVVSFNKGLKNYTRISQAKKYGIIDTVIVCLLITVVFWVFASPVSDLFGLSLPEVSADGIKKTDVLYTCRQALRIATLGYAFMGVSVAIQGVLQGLNNVFKPIIISALRLVVFVVPLAALFCCLPSVEKNFWWVFPIAEVLTAIISVILLLPSLSKAKQELL